MISRGRSFVLISALALSAGTAQQARADYVGNKFTEAATGQVLEYNVFVPTGYDASKKYPLMVVLHAANNTNPPNRTLSSDGKGWAATFIGSSQQATDPSFFMIPISQTNASGWGEATQPIATAEKFEGRLTVLVLKQDVMTKYNIDPARLYITGPSMGGRGTWDIIRRYPGMFAAAVPAAAPASPADAALYLNQNIWAVCGQNDPIVQGERDTIVAIRALGGNPIYTELAGHGHDSWRWLYPDPQLRPWIYAQRLGVPWWTVSKAPVGPFTGSSPAANLTTGWPATMPPANLPTGFGGASGSTGGNAGGGGTGVGGGSANGGGSGSAGRGGSTAGGQPGTGGAAPVPGTGGTGETGGVMGTGTGGGFGTGGTTSTGGAPALTASGGATASGGNPGTGGSAPGGTGATSGAVGGSGVSIAGDASGGCSYAAGRATGSSSVGAALLLSLFALRRRRRPEPRHSTEQTRRLPR